MLRAFGSVPELRIEAEAMSRLQCFISVGHSERRKMIRCYMQENCTVQFVVGRVSVAASYLDVVSWYRLYLYSHHWMLQVIHV